MKIYRAFIQIRHLILFVLLLAFVACKKNPPPPPPPPPPPTNSCRLVDETRDFTGTYDHYWYTYRSDGKLDSIYLSQVVGTGYVAWCKEDPDGFVWKTYQGTDGKAPFLYDYLYNSTTQDSAHFPTSLATSFQLWDGINTPSYGYDFQYKANGKLDGYQQTAPFVTGLLVGLGLEYTNDGDISSMVWSVTTGPKTSTSVTVKGYDSHPSPYSNFVGWVFLTPAVGWDNSEYEPLLYALSIHNPTESVYDNGTEKWTDDNTYEYNAQGYPTKRTVVRTGPTGSTVTYYHTYSYQCK